MVAYRALELKCWSWNYSEILHLDNKCELNDSMLRPQF